MSSLDMKAQVVGDDGNKLLIHLTKELSELDKDLTKGLASVGYMAKANKTELDGLSERVKALEVDLKKVQNRGAADEVRIRNLEEARKDHTGKFETLSGEKLRAEAEATKEGHKQKTERYKAKLAFWGPLILLFLTNVISLILHWAGVPSGD